MTKIVDFQAYKDKKTEPAPEDSDLPETVDLPVEMALAYAMVAIYRSGNVDTDIGDWLMEECYAARERGEFMIKVDTKTLLYLHEKRQARLNIEYATLCRDLGLDRG